METGTGAFVIVTMYERFVGTKPQIVYADWYTLVKDPMLFVNNSVNAWTSANLG